MIRENVLLGRCNRPNECRHTAQMHRPGANISFNARFLRAMGGFRYAQERAGTWARVRELGAGILVALSAGCVQGLEADK